ncbi:ATP-dependent helicase [Thiocapsa imhoffii]|uniref:ATP-dependent helicase n=2 Tax=Thiocapsa imhoffii TaxID=382777 RepID=A0A9X0WK69_9GAMM|nr:ATP-dependent helicase [Thiocapsa imhoffii]
MTTLHAFWRPANPGRFVQAGTLVLWAEQTPSPAEGAAPRRAAPRDERIHPFACPARAWPGLLEQLGIPQPEPGAIDRWTLLLPSNPDAPLPSPQRARALADAAREERASLIAWTLDGYRLDHPIKQLSDIHFLAFHQSAVIQPGPDFLFWYWLTQELKRLLMRDHYIPALIYSQPPPPQGKRKPPAYETRGAWQWASEHYEDLIAQAAMRMPPAAAPGAPGLAQGFEATSLLRHFSEVLLDRTLRTTAWPATVMKRTHGTLLAAALAQQPTLANPPGQGLEQYRQWQRWRHRLTMADQAQGFSLGFRLVEAPATAPDDWRLDLILVPKDDPSQRLALADYWTCSVAEKQSLHRRLGRDCERQLLLNLGLAARIYSPLWAGLDTATPHAIHLELEQAFHFLKEDAWVLENAGFKIVVPAWWTPQGRRRIKIRLRPSDPLTSAPAPGTTPGASALSLDALLRYRYELALGDQVIGPEEWRELVEAKTPLIQFRGQWVELDPETMQQLLAFWETHGDEEPRFALPELLRKIATEEVFELDRESTLAAMLEQLRDHQQLAPIAEPIGLKAQLRAYQRRGVAWIGFLEQLGLNGCLADDMGLGKTMQVIARLLSERESGPQPPTLLIAPTSVIGNWRKEVDIFAPSLRTLIHHGPTRVQQPADLREQTAGLDLVITSYALARRDQALLSAIDWHRVVLDEAQNIKNPKAQQTKAILKIKSRHRLALTGTPVENRLTDLWSIFNFMQPGYLDTQSRFRKAYEIPVQRDQNAVRATMLKRLVEPFILRRVKTDKTIIQDLPDKVEAKQYCNLSREQAALYESVVRDVERQLAEVSGIERQGLMLSTLMRLKQICNHPAQFLQDGSAFTPERSHKLERLDGMLEEVMAAGDSILIFSQFTEIGAQLDRLLRQERGYPTHYLHGGTSRARREAMIAAFQDPESEPAIFILSLKAGGVGITLTKANHVVHFDRWWNPAVEDQASDRAFRIGQEKTVFVHKFVTLGTLEERIDEMIEQKKAVAGAIVGQDESWLTQLDNERFKSLIRLNRNALVD